MIISCAATIAFSQCSPVPFSVVEVFSSQGCSSCPTAEVMLDQMIAADQVSGRNAIYISEHVTYWDYLGWTDPFGDAQFYSRQQYYANIVSGNNNLYTPEVIANGTSICDSRAATQTAIDNSFSPGNPQAGVCLALKSNTSAPVLNVEYTLSGNYTGDELVMVLTENGLSTQVLAGENAGKTLNESGVSRQFISTSITAATGTISITPPGNCIRTNSRIVAFVQNPATMAIVGGTLGIDLSQTTGTGEYTNNNDGEVTIYPNPASEYMDIRYDDQTIPFHVAICITDMAGKIVYAGQMNSTEGFAKRINVKDFSKGIYLVQLIADDHVSNHKISIQ